MLDVFHSASMCIVLTVSYLSLCSPFRDPYLLDPTLEYVKVGKQSLACSYDCG